MVTNTTGGSDLKNWTITVNDVTPPSQVTNLTNATYPTTHSINLGWDEATDNSGGSGIKDWHQFLLGHNNENLMGIVGQKVKKNRQSWVNNNG